MRMHLCVRFFGLVLSVGAVQTAAAQSLPPHDPAPLPVRIDTDGAVSIHADGVSVAALLGAFNPVCATEVRIDPVYARRLITLQLTRVPAPKAAGAILESAGLDFVIVGARCAARPHVMRIVAVERGTALPLNVAAHPDDGKGAAAVQFGSVPGGGPPDREVRDDAAETPNTGLTGTMSTAPARADGEITAAEMTTMLAPKPRPSSLIIELPFTGQEGALQYQVRPPGPRTTATLPFPDADGNAIQFPIPPASRPQPFTLPPTVLAPPGGPAPVPAKSANPADRRGGGFH